MAPKQSKMISLVNYRLRVTLSDSRTLTGQMLAFDRHMNLVLANCEEFRFVKQKKKKGAPVSDDLEELEMKRALGLIILRGDSIVSLSVEGPPPAVVDEKGPGMPPGAGRGMPAGRGMGIVPPSAAPQPMRGGPMSFPPPGMGGAPPPGQFMPPPGFPGAPPGFQGGPPPGFPGAPPPGFQGPPPGFMPPR